MSKRAVLAGVLLVVIGALSYSFVVMNRIDLSFTWVIDTLEESEPLDGQTLKVEGYVIRFPFQWVYGRGRVTIGEYEMRISRVSFVANIMGLRDIYLWTLFNDEWRQNPEGPVTGSGSIIGTLEEGRIEQVTLVLQFPKHDRWVQLRAFPAP